MFNFVTVGNDCSRILEVCLQRLKELYPNSQVFLYDWGHEEKVITRLIKVNPNLKVIEWPSANATNYMYEKVVCIDDCFKNHHDAPLVYLDADVIINDRIDEILYDDSWDIAATWRPEFEYRRNEFGVGAWLNAGVLFINNRDVDNSMAFLQVWKGRCSTWEEKSWWLDQVELIKLFSLADQDLSRGPNLTGILQLDNRAITLKTLHYLIYNFLPEMPEAYVDYDSTKAKIFHLKSPWRKIKFSLLPGFLKMRWIENMKNRDENNFWGILNYRLNSLIRALYNTKSYIVRLVRLIRRLPRIFKREFTIWRNRKLHTEIYYWKDKKRKMGDLYTYQIERAREYLKVFNNLNEVRVQAYSRVMDIGTGPAGGILDLLECDEKWAIEPIYSQYKKEGIWHWRSDLIVRETVCEQLSGVPENYFDIVFSMNALDHGENIEKCFRKTCEALKEGGLFYLHVHCRSEEQLNPLHQQAYTPEDLKHWLESCGFRVIQARVFEEDPIPTNKYTTFVGVMRKCRELRAE